MMLLAAEQTKLEALQWSWALDGWIIAVACLCAASASLLGNFLVLRRMSMLGDAISHAVLPGLAAAFFMSGSRSSLPMFIGAVVVGVLTAFFTQWIHRAGRVDEGASMGVVFTTLFAIGLLMIQQAAKNVDLDASCVLYGAIELTPLDRVSIGGVKIPRAAVVLSSVALLNLICVGLFYKELKLASFDPALATTLGFNATFMHYLLMVLVAITAVASFESVGNVLVVAMFVVPPAAAFLLTNRLHWMILISLMIAIASACLGHWSAMVVPRYYGFESTTTASMMSVVAGGLLLLAVLFSPTQGVVVRALRRIILSFRIVSDDVIAVLYRQEEKRTNGQAIGIGELSQILLCRTSMLRFAVGRLRKAGEVEGGEQLRLTDKGRAKAQNLVRSHRLWEQYLQEHAGVPPTRVHNTAERLEHFTDVGLRGKLDEETNRPGLDPHGRPIPEESDRS